jgi:hypothetical protein
MAALPYIYDPVRILRDNFMSSLDSGCYLLSAARCTAKQHRIADEQRTRFSKLWTVVSHLNAVQSNTLCSEGPLSTTLQDMISEDFPCDDLKDSKDGKNLRMNACIILSALIRQRLKASATAETGTQGSSAAGPDTSLEGSEMDAEPCKTCAS